MAKTKSPMKGEKKAPAKGEKNDKMPGYMKKAAMTAKGGKKGC